MDHQIKDTLNVKSVPKLASSVTTNATLTKLETLTIVAIMVSVLPISIGWFFLKAPNVPVVEPTNQEVSTISGVSTTTT